MDKRAKIIVALLCLPVFAALLMYFINPFGVPNRDPRGRVVGAVPYYEFSASMEPTIAQGTSFITCTAAYLSAGPARGDIIVFIPPNEPHTVYVKRVVALEGDVVELKEDAFLLDEVPQREAFVKGAPVYDPMIALVPKGMVFVMGDNREHSMDSRHFGPVALDAIVGKVCAGI